MARTEWRNLLRQECPKCCAGIIEEGKLFYCADDCGFKITRKRYDELIEEFSLKDLDTGENNINDAFEEAPEEDEYNDEVFY